MLKTTMIRTLVAGACLAALAASAPAATPSSPVVSSPAASPLASMPSATTASTGASGALTGADVNPYTGVTRSREQLLRDLDESKTRTAILEEQVKQAALSEDLVLVPAKKRSDGAQYLGKPRPRQDALAETTLAPPVVVKPKKVVATPVVTEAPQPVQIRVTSVIGAGADATAMLDVNGQTLVAHNGETTPYGVLHFEDAANLTLGARHLTLPSKMISRMAISDAQPIDAKAGADATAGGGSSPVFAPAASGRAALPPPIPAPPMATAPVSR